MSYAIPILLYHRIEDSSLSTATPPAMFRRQLSSLRERGWTAISADEFTHAMQSGASLPERSFMITFDDGYENIASVALDILRECECKAISFLTTQFLRGPKHGTSKAPDDGAAQDYMTWDQVRQLQASGIVDCQSHTHTHRNFSGCTADQICADLETSVGLLSYELGLPRKHFSHLAWPWGLSHPEWRGIAKRVGFDHQYTVSKQSFQLDGPLDEIPRTCFDATTFQQFQRQMWLQSGQLSQLWNVLYPFGRRLRQLPGRLRQAS